MNNNLDQQWKDKFVQIDVLHSIAGLATQILVQNNSTKESILLDCGDGSTRDILEKGINFNNLVGAVISHGHYDHCSGLHSLLGFLRMIGRTDDFKIVFPKGCSEVIGILNNFEQCYENSIPYKIIRIEIDNSDTKRSSLGSFTLKGYNVLHYGSTVKYGTGKQIPALGYSLIIENTKIAYSGDTGPTESLYEIFTDDIDCAIIEATHPDYTWVRDKEKRYHLTEEEAIKYTKKCKQRIIIHKLPKSVLEQRNN